jgi:hypothetical protein
MTQISRKSNSASPDWTSPNPTKPGSFVDQRAKRHLITIQERVFARVFTGLRTVADARYLSQLGFAPHCAELRRFTHKIFQTVENDRER